MKRFVIERDFEYKGFRCVVIFTKGGFRNGYVGYSEPHDLTDEEKEKKLNQSSGAMVELLILAAGKEAIIR